MKRSTIIALLVCLLWAVSADAMQRRQQWVVDTGGRPIPGATVTVYLAGTTTKATIYSDNGSTAIANPITVKASDGSYVYYVANGRYDELVAAVGFTFTAPTTADITMYDPIDISADAQLNRGKGIFNGITAPSSPIQGHTFWLNPTLNTLNGYDGAAWQTDANLATNNVVTFNTALGLSSMPLTTAAVHNVAVGYGALAALAGGDSNTAVGHLALNANISGPRNTAVGNSALLLHTGAGGGSDNVAVGTSALGACTAGGSNTAVGSQAMGVATNCNSSVAIGNQALLVNSGNGGNVAIGGQALWYNSTGALNTAIGQEAMSQNTTGGSNIGIGYGAFGSANPGVFRDVGSFGVAIGNGALSANAANNNVAVGHGAMQLSTTGANNVAVGYFAGFINGTVANVTGAQNVWIGSGAGPSSATQYSNAIAIGYGALTTANNQIVLGNSSSTSFVIGGSAKVAALSGGTGQDFSGSTGLVRIASGTFSAASTAYGRVVYSSTDPTTSSGTFADLTGASVTVTTGANPVLLGFTTSVFNSGVGNATDFRFTVDGGVDGGPWRVEEPTANGKIIVAMTHQTAALSAGSHTFKVQWATNGGTSTIPANTGSFPYTFWVQEIQ